jgi:hypothetical protein
VAGLQLIGESALVRLDRRVGVRFDRRYGVNTAGFTPLRELQITSPNRVYGVPYDPITPIIFRRMLQASPPPPDTFVFVDLGSGKGRSMLLAADYRFRRIVGVEFSPVLVSAAATNIAQYLAVTGRQDIFELHEGDAADFTFPDEPLALFLYNPFAEPVMRQVVQRLAATLEASPRDVIIYYRNPRAARLLSALPGLQRIRVTRAYGVYRFAAPRAPRPAPRGQPARPAAMPDR